MVMSGAHAAAFMPRPSESAAVPAPQLGVAAPVVGDVQQVVSGQRSFAMKLHDWLATHLSKPIYVGTGGARQLALAGEEILDVATETRASAPAGGTDVEAPFQTPKFMNPQKWIVNGKQAASQTYGSPATAGPVRHVSIDQPATGGKATLVQALKGGYSPCPPVLATCTTMFVVTGKEPVTSRTSSGEEILDLENERGAR